MAKLVNRNIVVLGAGRGIGAAIVRRVAAEGGQALAVSRSRAELDQFARDMPRVDVLELDAAMDGAPAKVFHAVDPNVLVVCGGARPPVTPIHELTWEQFSVNWDVDVRMSFQFCREALSRPLAPGSVVILISSGAALGGSPISGGYAGAKRMQMFIANYSQKESDRLGLGIRFIALAPAMIMPNTDLGQHAVNGYARYLGVPVADFIQSMKSSQTPEDVVEAVVQFAADPNVKAGSVFTVTGDGIAGVP
jgi:NAD(P)-dependent dehydrogenase (short-subunit alcohol dehydrogenase family)